MKIEIHCEKCLNRNERAERLIEALQFDVKLAREQYDNFKYVARHELKKRRSFWGWLFS